MGSNPAYTDFFFLGTCHFEICFVSGIRKLIKNGEKITLALLPGEAQTGYRLCNVFDCSLLSDAKGQWGLLLLLTFPCFVSFFKSNDLLWAYPMLMIPHALLHQSASQTVEFVRQQLFYNISPHRNQGLSGAIGEFEQPQWCWSSCCCSSRRWGSETHPVLIDRSRKKTK